MKYKREQTEHQSLLEYDLRKTLDRICELETIQNKLIKENNVKEGIINELKASFKQEKENLEAASSKELNELKFKYEAQIQELAINNNVDDLTQELIQCKVRIHNLEEANDSLQQQLLGKENEKETLTTTTTTSSDSSNTQLSQYDDNDQDVYASMSSLLSTFISYQTPDEKISLEKQVQRLSEMLHESEEKIIALKSQEKVLKDELRKMDAFDKRQNMNVEYLKNVLISFLTSNNKQAMVPILSKLLCLDETETNAIMKNCI
ncbi:uncharacterized protein BX663DRAFT_111458 [Cokeromyces recurvatus]|uniref:uncharacterized protein n=1 Tax=Cokeromyces recurvatus TaxID=90255 RepID=UPI002220EDE8|nr:uncharacterized protein BX663DRAFT_111458 [Cokeromyces recurvatus]KAI7901543.1 hypothetical protein BX663DRAFT_111458 [Cokeromyces recurvatus]